MKHSKEKKSPRSQKGFSKGKNHDQRRCGPIMIEDILTDAVQLSSKDVTVREMVIRTDPTNDSSPVIKRKFHPLNNPETILEVLEGILMIKQGVLGNNVTTGPLQYAYWRNCLEGTALAKFNEFTVAVGTETSAHLIQVEQRLVTHFAPREVLSQQARYIRYKMVKPYATTTRQYVGAVHTLNEKMEQLPPNFNADQKVPATELLDILASKAPKSHKELMTDHGFDPQSATIERFVEICERAETKEALKNKGKTQHFESDDDSISSGGPKKKPKKKTSSNKHGTARSRYYCRHHGPNGTHDSKECKVLLAEKGEKSDWKKTSKGEKYKDYKSKFAKKQRELNILQSETKKEKAKWIKMHKALRNQNTSDGEISEGDASLKRPSKRSDRTFMPKEETQRNASESENSSSSSSDDNSNSSSSSDSE